MLFKLDFFSRIRDKPFGFSVGERGCLYPSAQNDEKTRQSESIYFFCNHKQSFL